LAAGLYLEPLTEFTALSSRPLADFKKWSPPPGNGNEGRKRNGDSGRGREG